MDLFVIITIIIVYLMLGIFISFKVREISGRPLKWYMHATFAMIWGIAIIYVIVKEIVDLIKGRC